MTWPVYCVVTVLFVFFVLSGPRRRR